MLAQPFIAMRNDHQDALAAGLSVSEYAPSGKSADEIRGLWQWTQARLMMRPAAATDRTGFPINAARLPPADGSPSREHSPSWDAGL